MGLRTSKEDARWKLREAAEDARWSVREAAWSAEERVLWRSSDKAHKAIDRALDAISPLQRLIQTKLTWPLADRMEDYGTATRTAVATGAVLAAVAAGVAGTKLALPEDAQSPAGDGVLVSATNTASTAGSTLAGVAPDFKQTAAANPTTTVAAQAVPPRGAPANAPPPEKVAWDFAHAFVKYEVGKVDDKTRKTFSHVAAEPLAAALAGDPPRLPESAEVPEAEVLNVVVGEKKGTELEVSVSLLRLEAASELRLTLLETPEGWQVAEVRG